MSRYVSVCKSLSVKVKSLATRAFGLAGRRGLALESLKLSGETLFSGAKN